MVDYRIEQPWLTPTAAGWQLHIYVQPGARQTACIGVHGKALKIKISAPPADGKANQALLDWLHRNLKVPMRAIALISGHSSRQKVVTVAADHLSYEQIIAALTGAAGPLPASTYSVSRPVV